MISEFHTSEHNMLPEPRLQSPQTSRSKKLWGMNSIFNVILYLEKQFLKKNTWKYKIR